MGPLQIFVGVIVKFEFVLPIWKRVWIRWICSDSKHTDINKRVNARNPLLLGLLTMSTTICIMCNLDYKEVEYPKHLGIIATQDHYKWTALCSYQAIALDILLLYLDDISTSLIPIGGYSPLLISFLISLIPLANSILIFISNMKKILILNK